MSFTFEWEQHHGHWFAWLLPRTDDQREVGNGALIAQVTPNGAPHHTWNVELLDGHTIRTLATEMDALKWANHSLWHLGFDVAGWPEHEEPVQMGVEWGWDDTWEDRGPALCGWLDVRTPEQRVEGTGILLAFLFPPRPGQTDHEVDLLEGWKCDFMAYDDAIAWFVEELEGLGYLVPSIPPEL